MTTGQLAAVKAAAALLPTTDVGYVRCYDHDDCRHLATMSWQDVVGEVVIAQHPRKEVAEAMVDLLVNIPDLIAAAEGNVTAEQHTAKGKP